ncbi:hypothetical protein IMZ31_19165 (plasmid) [Pontibacillus sp. ALD_SL1]|uniref:hypothetical protein n=1 Tax=Pontibacillus sp. ALD_SL1 TaxID=2777185 RepID=UPI001A956CB0|nr:hypothetical protein [Pontibacillus sp. ALD_SL1]QST02671.1 hypothetical protein IMZ31_19165 [Pontibacillus sp. ALD_SL1]
MYTVTIEYQNGIRKSEKVPSHRDATRLEISLRREAFKNGTPYKTTSIRSW